MKNLFVPYAGKRPAALSINGHRLVILSADRLAVEESLNLLGGDRVKRVDVSGSREHQEAAISKLARSAHGGVVIAPADVNVGELIRNLSDELPWVQ